MRYVAAMSATLANADRAHLRLMFWVSIGLQPSEPIADKELTEWIAYCAVRGTRSIADVPERAEWRPSTLAAFALGSLLGGALATLLTLLVVGG